ncbi:Uncharacterized protein FKW44_001821, partial [Caligus rogercresseyi]
LRGSRLLRKADFNLGNTCVGLFRIRAQAERAFFRKSDPHGLGEATGDLVRDPGRVPGIHTSCQRKNVPETPHAFKMLISAIPHVA